MSVISGTTGAILGANAQRQATAANLAAARETNDLNRQMFDMSRGAYGHAFLPDYFQNFEDQTLGVDARNYYQATKDALGDPWQQEFRARTLRNQYAPDFAAADKTASGIWNGDITRQREANYAPSAAARTAGAAAKGQAINLALDKALNEIRAARMQGGFAGDSTFGRNRLLAATVGANQDVAKARTDAALANAQELQAIRDAGIQLRLSNLDLPYTRAQQAISFDQLPVDIMQSNAGRSLRPFEFFKMGTQPFRYDALPQVGAVPSAAQIALTGIGGANAQAGSYLLNRDLANRYNNPANYSGYNLPSNYYGLSGADQAAYRSALDYASTINPSLYE